MKNLLIRLTLGLYDQDILDDERVLIEQWLKLGYLKLEDKKYHLHTKYRAGTLSNTQNSIAYIQVLGANVKDLKVELDETPEAKMGDIVIVKRLLGKRGGASAKIVEIVGRETSFSIGFIKIKEGVKQLLDIRNEYPIGVEIESTTLDSYEENDVFQIDNQNGIIVKKLGNFKDPEVDEFIVLALYNKHDEFEDEVLKLASSFSKEVNIEEYPGRKDLRSFSFSTIDPVTAKDYDDAIYWDDKNHILYVAIADVSAYVTPFGPIDQEAIYRSFSIYLPHRSIPMLPRQLSETLCSLQPHVDRLAYVFEMHLDRTSLEVTSSEVYESVIHSKRRFTYEDIDAFFEGNLEAQNQDEEGVLKSISKLRLITDKLKKIRLQKGFDFRSKELQMSVKNHELFETSFAEETPSHALVEDCMLLANKAAASKYKHGVFRVHDSPSEAKLQSLYQELAGIGIIVELKESVKETISLIQEEARKRDLESEVDTLIIRAQMQARYDSDNAGHFGLGFAEYTHFTSPIRRYSDLIVHRHLKALESHDKLESSYVLRNIDALCISISEKERESSDIEIKYKNRKFARWAMKHIGEIFKARIQSNDPYLMAEVDDEIKGAKIALNGAHELNLFDDILIKIDRVNIATAKIEGSFVERMEKDN